MQVNPRHKGKYDQAFVNKAWGQMLGELDREMPVILPPAKSNGWKAAGIFLLFGLVLGIGGGIGYHLVELDKSSVVIDSKLAQAEMAIERPTDESVVNYTTSAASNSQNAQVHYDDLQVKTPSEIDHVFPLYPPSVASNIDVDMENAHFEALAYIPMSVGNAETDVVRNLQGIDVDESFDSEQQLIDIDPYDEDGKPDPAIGLTAGMNIFQANLWGGYYGGIIADYPVAQNFILRAGLTYSKLSDNSVLRYASASSRANGNHKSSSAFVRLDHMHYLNLPLAVSYQPFKFVRINSGVNVAYMIDADTELGSLSSVNNLGLSIAGVGREPFGDEAYSNWDVSLTYGLSLFPHPNWGFDISYNMGLTDIGLNDVLNTDDRNTHQQYQVSLLYYFYRKKK